MKSESKSGVTTPPSIVSPMPASGPIRPVLVEVIVSSEMSSNPCARFSSIAAPSPTMQAPHWGSVLKNCMCSFIRSARTSALSGYNF